MLVLCTDSALKMVVASADDRLTVYPPAGNNKATAASSRSLTQKNLLRRD
jgi:hypothetical protein